MVIVGGWRRVAAGVGAWAVACAPTAVVTPTVVVAEFTPAPVPTFEMVAPTGPTCLRERALYELAELRPYALPASCPPGLRTAPIVADRSLCDPRGPAADRPVWRAMRAESSRWRDGPTATRSAWIASHPGSASAGPSPRPRRSVPRINLDDLLRRAQLEQPLPRNSPYGPERSALWTDSTADARDALQAQVDLVAALRVPAAPRCRDELRVLRDRRIRRMHLRLSELHARAEASHPRWGATGEADDAQRRKLLARIGRLDELVASSELPQGVDRALAVALLSPTGVEAAVPDVAVPFVAALSARRGAAPAPMPDTSLGYRVLAARARSTAWRRAPAPSDRDRPMPVAAPPTEDTIELPPAIDRERVLAVLAPLRPAVRECVGSRAVTRRTEILVGGDGVVQRVVVSPAQARRYETGCIAEALRRARFPRFCAEAQQIDYPWVFSASP
jgi:hypothetical protein